MSDQMDMFRERKIAQMPTTSIGKAVAAVDEEAIENMVALLGSIRERTPVGTDNWANLTSALQELNKYLSRPEISGRIGA